MTAMLPRGTPTFHWIEGADIISQRQRVWPAQPIAVPGVGSPGEGRAPWQTGSRSAYNSGNDRFRRGTALESLPLKEPEYADQHKTGHDRLPVVQHDGKGEEHRCR